MQTAPLDPLRAQIERALGWEEAQVGFDKAVAGIPVHQRGARAAGFDHTPWGLLGHMRLAQKDLLDFCLNDRSEHVLAFPDDHWPKSAAPPDPDAWEASLADFRADREKVRQLVRDPGVDLFARVPAGKGPQTHLRAILLVIDHNAYQLGQMVAVRRALGCWP